MIGPPMTIMNPSDIFPTRYPIAIAMPKPTPNIPIPFQLKISILFLLLTYAKYRGGVSLKCKLVWRPRISGFPVPGFPDFSQQSPQRIYFRHGLPCEALA
jgi:hypothetical protein